MSRAADVHTQDWDTDVTTNKMFKSSTEKWWGTARRHEGHGQVKSRDVEQSKLQRPSEVPFSASDTQQWELNFSTLFFSIIGYRTVLLNLASICPARWLLSSWMWWRHRALTGNIPNTDKKISYIHLRLWLPHAKTLANANNFGFKMMLVKRCQHVTASVQLQ